MMQLLTAAALYMLAAARVPAMLRFGRDTVFFAAILTGTAAFLISPAVYIPVDAMMGGHNYAKLLQHSLMVVGLWQLRVGVLRAIAPESSRQRSRYISLPLYLTLVLQAIFFFAAGPLPTSTNFSGTFDSRPAGALFSAMVLVFVGIVCAEIALVCRRFVPRMHGPFRIGFILVGAGSALGALSAVFMVLDVLAHAVPAMAVWDFYSTPLYQAMQLVPTVLIGQGLTIPALAGRAERKRMALWEREALARVQPIRDHALQAAGLEGILELDGSAPVQDRLHRYIVEIWDAELAMGGASALTPEERNYLLTVEHKLDLERAP